MVQHITPSSQVRPSDSPDAGDAVKALMFAVLNNDFNLIISGSIKDCQTLAGNLFPILSSVGKLLPANVLGDITSELTGMENGTGIYAGSKGIQALMHSLTAADPRLKDTGGFINTFTSSTASIADKTGALAHFIFNYATACQGMVHPQSWGSVLEDFLHNEDKQGAFNTFRDAVTPWL